jgi:acyl-CoA hydrolase
MQGMCARARNIANAVLARLDAQPFAGLTTYAEVLADDAALSAPATAS